MACVDETTANAKAMGISLVIARSSQKQGCDLAQDFKPIELDVPLDKGFARISHHLAPISLGSGLRQQAQESARAGGFTHALSLPPDSPSRLTKVRRNCRRDARPGGAACCVDLLCSSNGR
jgi:hypothetical protein